MIEFTDDQIKAAAKTMKVLYLAGQPGMDHVAVKLNSEPTWHEIEQAKRWALALGYATRGDMRPYDAAIAIHEGRRP